MRRLLLPLVLAALSCTGTAAAGERARSLGDEPEPAARGAAAPAPAAASWREALARWRGAADVNAWIGERFEYDRERALQLSESQRGRGPAPAITAPEDFFAAPRGVCVDLARFAVETLRVLEPEAKPAYLMIEFAPVQIGGETLRLHWVALLERGGEVWVLGDSKRPGHLAGPYASVQAYVDDYQRWRGRDIVRWREAESYQRRTRTAASRQPREAQDNR